jgi:hypothetical protein
MMAMLLREKEVLVCAVSGEGNAGNAETGEGALEAVPSAEGSGVPPDLTRR